MPAACKPAKAAASPCWAPGSATTAVIQAQLGDVALGAGQGINLNFDGDGLLNLQVDKGSVDALAHNGGLIRADGGQVLMSARSADSLLKTVVNNQGTLEARTLRSAEGRIVLDGGEQGTVRVAGKQGRQRHRRRQWRPGAEPGRERRDTANRAGGHPCRPGRNRHLEDSLARGQRSRCRPGKRCR